MVILGNAAFGHMEAGDVQKYLVAGQPGEKDSIAVMLDFKNDSQKTIKTAVFSFLPLDEVNCVVSNRLAGREEVRLRFMGFIEPNEIKRQVYWENVWYSHEIAQIRLTKIDIAYTDGSRESLSGPQIHFECA